MPASTVVSLCPEANVYAAVFPVVVFASLSLASGRTFCVVKT
jgi:hypothetical protein